MSFFPDAQFNIQGFMLHRLLVDHRNNGGGLIMYVRGDLPQKQFDLDLCRSIVDNDIGRIEMLSVELNIKGDKWIIVNMYKKPQTPNAMLTNCVDNVLTFCTQSAPNVILCGDFNINMLSKNNCFHDTLDIHGIRNIVKDPTYYKGNDPTLLDLVITNVHKGFMSVALKAILAIFIK